MNMKRKGQNEHMQIVDFVIILYCVFVAVCFSFHPSYFVNIFSAFSQAKQILSDVFNSPI